MLFDDVEYFVCHSPHILRDVRGAFFRSIFKSFAVFRQFRVGYGEDISKRKYVNKSDELVSEGRMQNIERS